MQQLFEVRAGKQLSGSGQKTSAASSETVARRAKRARLPAYARLAACEERKSVEPGSTFTASEMSSAPTKPPPWLDWYTHAACPWLRGARSLSGLFACDAVTTLRPSTRVTASELSVAPMPRKMAQPAFTRKLDVCSAFSQLPGSFKCPEP